MTAQRKFIDNIAPYAIQDMQKTTVLASITIAQAALESAWGNSAPANNLFGIKGSGTTQTTQEYINGQWVTIKAGFRSYQSWLESIHDHSQFLIVNPRYAKAGFFKACMKLDYKEAAYSLQKAGYATDPSYASKLITIIDKWELHNYDKEGTKPVSENAELLKKIEALEMKVSELEKNSNLPAIPVWAELAVKDAYETGLITDVRGSYDFYRILTALHRLQHM